MNKDSSIPNFCGFCDKSRNEVNKLIIGGAHAICDECVIKCKILLTDQQNAEIKKSKRAAKHTNPVKIKQYLDQHVIGQEAAKITLCVGVANHYKRLFYNTSVRVEKSNILLLGPTGSGKTLLAKTIAEFLDVPFVIADATSLTETGYVGEDVESVISRLLAAAAGDVERTQRGIVFLDEVDKIGKKNESSSAHRDISGEGVQQALLKLVEGAMLTVSTEPSKKHPGQSTVEIDTSGILFIASGAFVGLQEIVNRRHKEHRLGFDKTATIKTNTIGATNEDLIKFGMIPEFVGRFPVTVHTQALTTQDLVKVLTSTKHNLIEQYRFYFETDGIGIEFTPAALESVAQQAIVMKTGARALRSILEQQLIPHLFRIPHYKQQKIERIQFTAQVFDSGAEPIMYYKQSKSNKVIKAK